MTSNKAKVHDIVQVNHQHEWVGCLIYVTELKSFGIQGFIHVPGEGQAFIRLNEADYEVIGPAALRIQLEDNETHE